MKTLSEVLLGRGGVGQTDYQGVEYFGPTLMDDPHHDDCVFIRWNARSAAFGGPEVSAQWYCCGDCPSRKALQDEREQSRRELVARLSI